MQRTRLIFDGDGTLYDSGHGIKTSANYALDQLGYATFPIQEMDFFVGPPLKECFRLCHVREEDLDKIVDIYIRHQKEVTKFDLKLYPDVGKTLHRCKERGYLVYLGTSKRKTLARELLIHLGIESLFDGIYGAEDDGSKASKVEVLQKVVDSTPDCMDTYMVGDSKFDILGGQHFHMKTIAVSYGYGDRKELQESGPDYMIDDFADLLNIVK